MLGSPPREELPCAGMLLLLLLLLPLRKPNTLACRRNCCDGRIRDASAAKNDDDDAAFSPPVAPLPPSAPLLSNARLTRASVVDTGYQTDSFSANHRPHRGYLSLTETYLGRM